MNNIRLINKLLFYPMCSEEILYSMTHGTVLLFENEIKSKTIVLILKEFLESDFLNKLNNIRHELGNNFSCKVIGNYKSNQSFIALLKLKNIMITKEVLRENHFDIIYFSRLNKLRLSKDTNLPAKIKKINVLIVDDSPTIRNLLSKILNQSEKFNIVGSLGDPLEVEDFLKSNSVDLITLDIHMPGLNGVQLLKKIFPRFHIPTVMISSIRIEEGPYIMEALESGAIDYIEKPSLSELSSITPYILEKLEAAADCKREKKYLIKKVAIKETISNGYKVNSLIVIGASTGGVEALKELLERMPDEIPPILIVQHIPEVFSKAFAIRLNRLCKFQVKEAEDQEEINCNTVYIAPGGKHLTVVSYSGNLRVSLSLGPKVNRFRPSVDVLFNSLADSFLNNTVAALLTGMGKDGAKGLLALKKAGAATIAQNEESCIVFGMPKEAIELNAADYILSIDQIPVKLVELLSR